MNESLYIAHKNNNNNKTTLPYTILREDQRGRSGYYQEGYYQDGYYQEGYYQELTSM